jgi:hypothetical protein
MVGTRRKVNQRNSWLLISFSNVQGCDIADSDISWHQICRDVRIAEEYLTRYFMRGKEQYRNICMA